jgi:hypothetical protein
MKIEIERFVENIINLGRVVLFLFLSGLAVILILWYYYMFVVSESPECDGRGLDKTRISRVINVDTQVNNLRAALVGGDDFAFRFLAELVGETYELDSHLLYRLWWLESRFKFDARSSRDAIGLGQVRLVSARWHFSPLVEEVDLYDPILNGFISGKILRDYLNEAGGDMSEALLYYHAGPDRVRSFRARGEKPFNLWYSEKLLAAS